MKDNMTPSEQLKWVLAETGRQIVSGVKWLFYDNPMNTFDIIAHELPYALEMRRLQNRKIRNLLANLTDETLLDRLIGTTEIPVHGDDRPQVITVRVKAHRLRLIQDIR